MVKIFIIFLIIIIGFAVVIGIAVSLRSRKGVDDIDRQYYDGEGNHMYYDRSMIEKSEFTRLHPDEKPRSLRRLFNRKK